MLPIRDHRSVRNRPDLQLQLEQLAAGPCVLRLQGKQISNVQDWKYKLYDDRPVAVVPTLPGTDITCAFKPALISLYGQDIYPSLKAQYPMEGRRKWKLRVAEQFWKLDPDSKPLLTMAQVVSTEAFTIHGNAVTYLTQGVDPVSWENADFVTDSDRWDELTLNIAEIGILVRTDYADEDAWQAFHAKLKDAEKEFASEATPVADKMVEDESPSDAQNQPTQGSDAMQEDSSDDNYDEDLGPIFKIVNPQSSEDREQLTAISNLSALRLLNDVDIRLAPAPPPSTKRIKPPNRLVDLDGWQEVYGGKMLWIYDAKSNDDQCVRVVNQQGDMYGTAA